MWKTLAGRCIYKSENIRVYQNFFYRWLTFNDNNAYQSVINRKNPEVPGLSYLTHLTFAARLQPLDCCILGLGGGGAAHLLSQYLENSSIVAVENSPEIIKISKKFFMLDKIKNLLIIEQDAYEFVRLHQQCYQHLLVDLFHADAFPEHCNTIDFFTNCKKRLLPNGIIAVNIANDSEKWGIFKHMRAIFHASTVVVPVKDTSNLIILGCNNSSVLPLLQLLKNNWRLKKLSWDDKWGCMAHL